MMGTKGRSFAPEVTVCLDTLVPEDEFYRHLEHTLDLAFVRDLVQERYAGAGRPSIDPVVFFKLQLILFFEGLRSERQLMRVVADRLSLRWYLGYDFGQSVPDHSSLTRIRDRYGLAVFQRFFERVVELCQQAGLVWGKELFFDATKVQANADIDTLVPRFALQARVQAHLDALFAAETDAVAAPAATAPTANLLTTVAVPAPEAPAPTLLPTATTLELRAQLAQEQATTWKLLDQLRLDPERPPSGPYQRLSDLRVSTTDPDATPMQISGGGARLGYYDHYVVDGGKARIILAALVTPADVKENLPMPDLLRRVRFRYHLHPKRAIADAGYGTGEVLRAMEAEGVQAYIPVLDHGEGETGGFFAPSAFIYDPEHDLYRCPAGAELRARGNSYQTHTRIYQAPKATCQSCPLRARCTDSAQGRKVGRHFDEEYRERARRAQETAAYAKAMRKRSVWVEPLFGEAKQWHGLRQFRLRGLEKVNDAALLTAAGQNLKRLVAARGWGRRPAPCGSLLAVPQSREQTSVIVVVVTQIGGARPAGWSGLGHFWEVQLPRVCWLGLRLR